MEKDVVCFGFCCIFVPATSSCNQLVTDNNFCLDNPVGQVSFLLVGCRMVSLPPNRAFIFVKQRHYHAHRNHRAFRQAHSPAQINPGRIHHCNDAAQGNQKPRAAQDPGANFPPFTRFTLTPLSPRRRFQHKYFLNRLAPGEGVRLHAIFYWLHGLEYSTLGEHLKAIFYYPRHEYKRS